MLCGLLSDAHLEKKTLQVILAHAFNAVFEDEYRLWLGSWHATLLLRALRDGPIINTPLSPRVFLCNASLTGYRVPHGGSAWSKQLQI